MLWAASLIDLLAGLRERALVEVMGDSGPDTENQRQTRRKQRAKDTLVHGSSLDGEGAARTLPQSDRAIGVCAPILNAASVDPFSGPRDRGAHLRRRGAADVVACGDRSFQGQKIEHIGVDRR